MEVASETRSVILTGPRPIKAHDGPNRKARRAQAAADRREARAVRKLIANVKRTANRRKAK